MDSNTIPYTQEGKPRPRVAKRLKWVVLPARDKDGEDAYPGFEMRMWVNYPSVLLDEIRSGVQERVRAALLQIVVEHNGWMDEAGEDFPPTTDPSFWDIIPTELATVMIVLIQKEATTLPNSLLLTKQG